MKKTLPLIVVAILFLALTGCVTGVDGRKHLPFDVNASLEYEGVKVTGTNAGGRTAVGVDVDAKQIVRAIRER